jgi:hypothetical protein
MAMYVLNHMDCPNSPIFDMESVFWILLYVPLNRSVAFNPEACEDDREMLGSLIPEDTMRLGSVINSKMHILLSLLRPWLVDADSCLHPYKELLYALSRKVDAYYDLARQHRKKKTWFGDKEEDRAVAGYIHEIQKFFGASKDIISH